MGLISVIVPCYNEEESIRELYGELTGSLQGREYEILFINDGSTDSSEEILRELCNKDTRVKLVNLKKNLGQTPAMAAGFDYCRGDYVVTIDSDLQNDPKDIPMLIKRMDEGGFDIVSGFRAKRKDPFLTRKLPSKIANFIIAKVTGVKLTDFGCTLKVYKREVVKNLRLYGEMHRFIPAIANLRGAKIDEVAVNHRKRKYGQSKYGLKRTFKVLLDLITLKFMGSYSTRPLYFFGGAGFISIIASFLALFSLIYLKVFYGYPMIKSPLLLLSALLFLVGFICILIGLLAEIMTRIYFEGQGKKIYIIKDSVNIDDKTNECVE